MQFDLVTPSKLVSSMEADYVMVPGQEGSFGVMDGHALVISSLRPGVLSVKSGEDETTYCVGYGLADVQNDRVTILAEEVVVTADIDAAATQKELEALSSEIEALSGNEAKAIQLAKLEKRKVYLEALLEASA